MKSILTILLASVILSVSAQITIPNAGFESFVAGTYFIPQLPAGWTCHGDVFPGVAQSADAHSGSSSLKMSVATYMTGVGGDHLYSAFRTPVSSSAPAYYTFWAKIYLSGTDKLWTKAYMTNTGSTIIVNNVDYNRSSLSASDNSSVWKQISFPIQTSPGAFDSVSLEFYFYPQLDTASHILIDDLAFSDTQYTGVNDISAQDAIEAVYPNPARGFANVVYNIAEQAQVSMDIYDINGTKMASPMSDIQAVGKYKVELPIESYANGIYLIKLTVNGVTHLHKLIIAQ